MIGLYRVAESVRAGLLVTFWLILILALWLASPFHIVTVAPAQERPSIRVGHGATHYCALRGEKVMRSLKVDRQ